MSKRARTGYYGSLAKKAHLLKPFIAGGIRGFFINIRVGIPGIISQIFKKYSSDSSTGITMGY